MKPRIGFMVIYRWRLRTGKEEQFREAWTHFTTIYMEQCGALGSRLHRSDDGTWVAYAQWRNKDAWEQSPSSELLDPRVRGLMLDAIAESFPPTPLWPVVDRLLEGEIVVKI